jgi:hypothetical protein
MGDIAKIGKVAPHAEKLTTDHREHTDMDIRSEGTSENANMPKP